MIVFLVVRLERLVVISFYVMFWVGLVGRKCMFLMRVLVVMMRGLVLSSVVLLRRLCVVGWSGRVCRVVRKLDLVIVIFFC